MKETIIRQYRKKPVIVEAVQLDNINVPLVVQWIGEDKAKMNLESDEAWKLGKAPPIFSVTICTLEGDMKAMPGDFIIKGVHGEFYPCKPDIFEKTYEAVEPPKEERGNMSILIQGLSMPDEGCHHTICVYADGKVETGEPNSYQAVPVPPHGRLGDLDMVEAMIMEYIEEYGATKDENGNYSEKWCAMKEAEMVIQNTPTIIEAEEGE